jgi:hypothetical protein
LPQHFEHIEEQLVSPHRPCKLPEIWEKKKGSNNIKTEKEGENFLAAKAQINEVKEEMYHSKIDLVGVGVSKKSLGYTSDGVLRSWAHMLPPSKGPA